jgi:hypothetical protein
MNEGIRDGGLGLRLPKLLQEERGLKLPAKFFCFFS